jgi:hypothetical protein
MRERGFSEGHRSEKNKKRDKVSSESYFKSEMKQDSST